MKTLTIEWKYLELDGETCDRCNNTGIKLKSEIERLNKALHTHNANIELIETKLDGNQIANSNELLFNGVPIEKILNISISENFCESCSEMIGSNTYCRTINYDGKEYEEIPEKAIRQATYIALGIEEAPKIVLKKGCSCNGNGKGKGCCY